MERANAFHEAGYGDAMRKWQDLAPPNDPGSWYAVDGMCPTPIGTYETAHIGTAVEYTLTGATTTPVIYAFQGNTLSGRREYVVTRVNATGVMAPIENAAGTFTDRSGSVTGNYPMMAQYGNITIMVAGAAVNTQSSSGGNFSALAGAPQGEIVCVQSNAVLIFNTNTSTDGWAASDVGDYTNWTTGEAASGRLIKTPGAITAAVPFGEYVYVFKKNSIYRMRYVGGVVKWATEVVYVGIGCITSSIELMSKYAACAGKNGILFNGGNSGDSYTSSDKFFLFDGSNPPICVNDLTTVSNQGSISYNPITDTFCIWYGTGGGKVHYYNATANAWGYRSEPLGSSYTTQTCSLMGEWGAYNGSSEIAQNTRIVFAREAVDKIKRYDFRQGGATETSYVESSMYGTPDRKTLFSRVTPLVRKRRDLGTDSVSLSMKLYRELTSDTPTSTLTIAESSQRNRFDVLASYAADCFARLRVTWTGILAEVDDLMVTKRDAGAD